MTARYAISQIDPLTWQLSAVADSGVWEFIGRFGSEGDATAAMTNFITARKWVAPSPKYYDETGALMAQPVLP